MVNRDFQEKDEKLEEKKIDKPVEEVKEEVKVDEAPKEDKDSSERDKKSEEQVSKSPAKASESKPEGLGDTKTETKKEIKKPAEKKLESPKGPKKTEAVVNGRSLRISTKHSIAVCNFIRDKNVDKAILNLEEVSKMKKPIPMRGEIPHKKGIMSGRYPINAVNAFLTLLKSVKSNAIVNELELEKVKIFCKANVASRPSRRFGQGKHKRSHVQIKLIPIGGKK